MASVLTVILLASCLAMVALFYIKHWELSRSRVFLPRLRPAMAHLAHQFLAAIEYHLPRLARLYWRQLLHWIRTTARHGLAHALLATEEALEHALHALRHKTTPPVEATGSASAFLREVTAYKKRLARRTRRVGPAPELRAPALAADGIPHEIFVEE